MPVRLRLSRQKGFNLQDHSMAINGLAAVNVARRSKWGNPYKIGDPVYNAETGRTRKTGMTAEEAVEKYRKRVCVGGEFSAMVLRELRGKNLACWCRLDSEHCHADVLLGLANRPICEEVR